MKSLGRHMLALVALTSLASPSMVACDETEPFFRSCPLSTSIVAICKEDQPNTELTCVVTQHPMCDEGVCAAWEGSGTFCSRTCTGSSECPPESACLPYLDGTLSVCVPDERPAPGQLTP